MSREFINLLSQKIDNIPNFPVLKSLAIAQACLESRFGQKHFYNNIFGIKCHNPNLYAGCRLGRTAEFIDGSYQHNLRLAFQVYDSFDDSLKDYARLMNIKRYERVRQATSYMEATQAVRDCGYATSPTYVANLRRLIEQYKLYELDNKMEEEKYILPPDFELTKNFTYYEFWSNNFGKPKVEPPAAYYYYILHLAESLQTVRDKLNADFKKKIWILITSGYRTPEWNKSKSVEGANDSKHLYGMAADSRAIGVPLFVYYTYLMRYTDLNHIGYYKAMNFVHAGIDDNFTIFKY